jgi:hypothetical protein
MRLPAVSVLVAAFQAIGLAASVAQAATHYTAIDLNPIGFTSSSAAGVSGALQAGTASDESQVSHPFLWNSSAGVYTDLAGDGLTFGYLLASDGTQHVGGGYVAAIEQEHALLWTGTSRAYVDLNPAQFTTSFARGVAGGQQVGEGVTQGGDGHALLWRGTSDSCVDLNPAGFLNSRAQGTNGTQQVGYGEEMSSQCYHALLWSGTSTGYVDLNPPGFANSYALGIGGQQKVGNGNTSEADSHALLWSGPANTFVDLNPTGFDISIAYGTNGIQQVGDGNGTATGGATHALLWSGTAGNYVDLHQFLGDGYTDSSAAAIDAQGNIVGYATDLSNNQHAILWRADIPGDADGNGLVDQSDYKIWYDNYGTGTTWEQGNFKGAGLVDQEDYKIWYDNYGAGQAGGAVPEPATLAMLALGGLGMLSRARCRPGKS